MTNIGSGSGTSDQNMGLWDPPASTTNSTNGTSASATSPSQTASFKDTVGVLSGLGKIAPDYVYGTGNPQLPHPSPQSSNFEWANASKDIAKHLQDKAGKPSLNQSTMNAIDQAIAKLFQENPDQLLSKFGGMTQEQVDAKLKYAVFHPDTNNPSDPIQQMAKVLAEQIQEVMKGDGVEAPQEFDQQVQQTFVNSFSLLLEKDDSPPQDKQAVEYAFFNPEAQAALTPAQKKLFDGLLAQSMQKISGTYGVPLTEVPTVDKESAYNIRLNIGFGDKYIEGLSQLKADGKITDAEFKALRTRLYYPDSVPIDEKMKGIESKLQQDVFTAFVQENGLPSTFKPTVPTNGFDAWSNGLYRDTFRNLAQNHKPPIDAATQQKLLAAMADPEHVPKNIQQLFDEINNKAVSTAISTLGLPAAWKPDQLTVNPLLDPKMANVLNGAKSYLNEVAELQKNLFTQLASGEVNGVKAANYMSYLQIIGKALDELQQMIYAIESNNGKISKLLNSITLDMQMNKIEKMKKEAEERKKAEEAGHSGIKGLLNDLGNILGPIMAIVTILVAIALTMIPPLMAFSPMFMAIAVGSLVNAASKAAGYDMMKEGFKMIDDLIASMIPISGLREACQIIVKALIIAYVLLICSTSGLAGGILAMQVGMEMMMSSNVIGATVKACGGDEEAQMIVTMVVMITIMVVILAVMIVVGIVLFFMPAAAAAEGGAALGVGAGVGAGALAEGAAAGGAAGGEITVEVGGMTAKMIVDCAIEAAAAVGRTLTQAAETGTQISAETIAQAMAATEEMVMNTIAKAVPLGTQVTTETLAQAAAQGAATVSKSIMEAAAAGTEITAEVIAQAAAQGAAVSARTIVGAAPAAAEITLDTAVAGVDTASNALETVGSAAEKASKAERLLNAAKKWAEGFNNQEEFFRRIKRFAELANAGATIADQSFKAVQAGSNMVLNLELADLAIKIANFKADQEELEGMIKQLKKCIEMLMNEIGGMADFVQSINKLQTKKFKDADFTPISF